MKPETHPDAGGVRVAADLDSLRDTREAAIRWADVWERGWREHDSKAIPPSTRRAWQQHPFREPEPDYLARVFVEEESAQCEFGAPLVDGDRAAVPWRAQTKLVGAGAEDLVGGLTLTLRRGRTGRRGAARLDRALVGE